MSHIQYKKHNCADTDKSSVASSDHDHCFEHPRACIVCPPCDYHEQYDSSSSDSSCPDFSKLCEDEPKICCEKRDLCKKKHHKDSEESSHSDEDVKRKNHICKGCNERCGKCSNCKECNERCGKCSNCKECSDFSRSSVVNALSGSESSSKCPRFEKLALDEKRKCRKLTSLCKKETVNVSDKKDTSSSSCDKKDSCQSDKTEFFSSSKKNSYKSNKKESGSSSGKGKKFVVTFRPKEGHQWAEYNVGNLSVHINGKNGPVIHIYRECTYFFCVEQDIIEGEDPKHALILTNSPAGGPDSRIITGGFTPVSKGCVCFKVDKSTPRYFFYQDSKNAFAGGLVIVHDK